MQDFEQQTITEFARFRVNNLHRYSLRASSLFGGYHEKVDTREETRSRAARFARKLAQVKNSSCKRGLTLTVFSGVRRESKMLQKRNMFYFILSDLSRST